MENARRQLLKTGVYNFIFMFLQIKCYSPRFLIPFEPIIRSNPFVRIKSPFNFAGGIEDTNGFVRIIGSNGIKNLGEQSPSALIPGFDRLLRSNISFDIIIIDCVIQMGSDSVECKNFRSNAFDRN